jgi:hypothetical protein
MEPRMSQSKESLFSKIDRASEPLPRNQPPTRLSQYLGNARKILLESDRQTRLVLFERLETLVVRCKGGGAVS